MTACRRIAALGDSTSCGEGVGLRLPLRATWPARLATAAAAELVPLAVAGARLRDVRQHQVDAAVRSGADVVTLLVGLNDVARGGFDGPEYGATLTESVSLLQASGALVLVGRLPDMTLLLPLPPGLRAAVLRRTAEVNAAVDSCAGRRVRVVDLASLPGLRLRPAWDVDRVHPNAAGHAVIAAAAAAVLREAGCALTPLLPVRLPPAPGRRREAAWLLRHGLPWLGGHLPQVVAPAVTATLAPSR